MLLQSYHEIWTYCIHISWYFRLSDDRQNDLPIAKYAVNQIRWRRVEHDEVDRLSNEMDEFVFEIDRKTFERLGWCLLEQNCQIHVAVADTCAAARLTAEEVGDDHAVAVGFEKRLKRPGYPPRVHGRNYGEATCARLAPCDILSHSLHASVLSGSPLQRFSPAVAPCFASAAVVVPRSARAVRA